MTKLTPEATIKLQRILSKRVGRELSDEELEEAYDALMGFAIALVELSDDEPGIKPPLKKTVFIPKMPIANYKENVLQYV